LVPARTAPPELHTLSLHDALPISIVAAPVEVATPAAKLPPAVTARGPAAVRSPARAISSAASSVTPAPLTAPVAAMAPPVLRKRSEEHTSELQSRENLVCRLLLEK